VSRVVGKEFGWCSGVFPLKKESVSELGVLWLRRDEREVVPGTRKLDPVMG